MADIGSIPSSWIAITGVLSAEAHLNLMREVRKRTIDPHDRAAVELVWQDTKARILRSRRALLSEKSLLRKRLERINAELKLNELQCPGGSL